MGQDRMEPFGGLNGDEVKEEIGNGGSGHHPSG